MINDGAARNSQWAKLVKDGLILPTVLAGVVLPVDFLSQIDGYMMYLRPWELFPVFGLAWISYFMVGFVGSVILTGASKGFSVLLRRDLTNAAVNITFWLSLSLIALTLFRNGKAWATGLPQFASVVSLLIRFKYGIVVAILTGCALWVWRQRGNFDSVGKLAYAGTALGGAITAVAMAITLFHATGGIQGAGTTVPQGVMKRLPDIILLTSDAMAANHLSLYNYQRQTTPSLSQFAQEATVFERYYANGNFTTAAVNSFINGVRPWTHRANQFLAEVDPMFANQGLIARLKQKGYQTLAVTTNPDAAPFHNGNTPWMDRTADGKLHDSLSIAQAILARKFPHFMPVSNLSVMVIWSIVMNRIMVWTHLWSRTGHFDPELAFKSARELVQNRDRTLPMFLWVHLISPHAPYAAPLPFGGSVDPGPSRRERFNSTPPYGFTVADDPSFPTLYADRYDESVKYTDHALGEFLDWLKTESLYRNALIVFSTDHGESFSHQYGGHGGPMLHEDLIHIPLIVKEPQQVLGQRCNVLSEQIDLMPTLLELIGLPGGRTEGRSLVPALRGGRLDGPVFSMNFEQSNRFGPLTKGEVAMVEGTWKYIYYFGDLHYPNMPKLESSLYDLKTDLGETKNLAEENPGIALAMRAAIEKKLNQSSTAKP